MMNQIEKARADFIRAQALEWGEGRPADLPAAARLYRRSAMRGLADAQHALGFLYATGQGVPRNEEIAVHWFTAAAERGHCAAQHNLAVMYAEGRGVEQSDQDAVNWFYQAALNGSDVARDWLSATRHQLRDRIAVDG